VEDIMIHAITDGRDTSPTGASDYLAMVSAQIYKTGARSQR
jgi:Phosphoglyceromutase